MATKLATYDFTKPSSLTKTERRAYPWDEWLDGNIWQITYGEDFEAHPLMMERIIRTRATAKHAKVKLRHEALNGDDTGIIVLRRSDIAQPKPPRSRKAAPAKATAPAPSKKAAAKAVIGDTAKVTKPAATKKTPATKKVATTRPPAKRATAPAKKVATAAVPSKKAPSKKVKK